MTESHCNKFYVILLGSCRKVADKIRTFSSLKVFKMTDTLKKG